ncbi:MAG: SCP2 sterol-binding domain-containing protein [Candidatus Dormibacteraeota bacterium]|nr:SCP2 sterol-binding domain-containing protein [Candidatus Dormibacteraeota bacterium]
MSEQVDTPEHGGESGGADEAPGGHPAAGGQPQSAAELAALLEGHSDEEINAAIKAMGYDAVLGQIFSEMQTRFLPDKAAGRNAVIHYEVNTPEGPEVYQVVVADGACTTGKGGDKEPTVTLALSLSDFLRLISGKLNGVQAFMSGKLKIRGDMMLAQTMQGWFDQA